MSDKPSYLGLLNAIAVGEAQAHCYLSAWIDKTKSPGVKATLSTVAAREGEHGMSFAKRINELGYTVRRNDDEDVAFQKRLAIAGSDRSDLEKMEKLGLGRLDTGDKPDIFDRMFNDHSIDIATGTLLGRYIAEERDSGRLLKACYDALQSGGGANAAADDRLAALETKLDAVCSAIGELQATMSSANGNGNGKTNGTRTRAKAKALTASSAVENELGAIRSEAAAWFEANWNPDLTLDEWWNRYGLSGWAYPTWPARAFGKGLDKEAAAVVAEERDRVGAYGAPSGIGPMMAGPTVAEHGTDEQIQRLLPGMVTGEHIWCQLFSEPGSGSDLASIQTFAERDGDEWIVNGQKVWTSGAQYSRYGILIARTNRDVPKHDGITYFVIDLDQPGVEVRPLKEMTGGATFNEVFFNDARVNDENRIGDVDHGWSVAVTTLSHERKNLGGNMGAMGGAMLGIGIGNEGGPPRPDGSARVGDLGGGGGFAGAFGGDMFKMLPMMFPGKNRDPLIRQDMAKLYTQMEIMRYTQLRSKAAAERGDAPGPEQSTGKLAVSHMMRSMRDFLFRLQGPAGALMGPDAPMGGMFQWMALFSPAISIAGGTDEIQRNIIGERVLGLPPEPRADKDLLFRELLHN